MVFGQTRLKKRIQNKLHTQKRRRFNMNNIKTRLHSGLKSLFVAKINFLEVEIAPMGLRGEGN